MGIRNPGKRTRPTQKTQTSSKPCYLVAYDVHCPKRLKRAHRYLKSRGLAVQYSVFLLQMTKSEIRQLLSELQPLLHPAEDDLRAFPCEGRRAMWLAGKGSEVWMQPVSVAARTPENEPPRKSLLGWLFR